MLSRIVSSLRGLLLRERANTEADEEIQFHVEMETQANVALGMTAEEARRVALRDLGGVSQARESVRDVRSLWLESILQDLVYAFRVLRRHPTVFVGAVAMLGLGIGLTTAMFTLVDTLILRPVPFRDPDQLALLYMGDSHGGRTTVAPAVLRAWQHSPSFSGAESADVGEVLLTADGFVSVQEMARVTSGLFDLLGGVRPLRGRLFDERDGHVGDRVILSEDLWRNLYRADPALVGRTVTLDGKPLLVVGILPADFRFPSWNTAIWRAVDFESLPAADADRRAVAYVRFAPSMPRRDAERMSTNAARAADAANGRLWTRVQPLVDDFRNPYYQRALPLLAGGVVLVFFVLCANVCSLLLARVTARQQEFAMRSALGASRARLIRQSLVEGSALGALGIVAGTAVAWALVSVSRAFLPEAFLLHTLKTLRLDETALVVSAVCGLVATIAVGVIPAWLGTRPHPESSLRVTDRGTETRGARAAAQALLVAEVALACTLLVAATLLVRSFVNLATADRGLDAEDVLVATVSLDDAAFPDGPSRESALRAIDDQVARLPGVRAVAWSYGNPPGGGWTSYGKWQSDAPGAPAVDMAVDGYSVGPGFFGVYGIELVRGRLFSPSDPANAVVVGERLARVLWPGLDPIGRRFSFETWKEPSLVVGIAREIHFPSLNPRLDLPQFYMRMEGPHGLAMMSLRMAAAGPNAGVLHERVVAAHPAVQCLGVRTLNSMYFQELARPRAAAALAFAFAVIAVLATAGGLFSVLSYAVATRRREFGIRTALGASAGQIGALVLRSTARVILGGTAIGAAGAWLLARAVTSLQYGVTITDPAVWIGVLGVLVATSVAASWRPARQAMGADPVVLLREE
ncbi:MAG: ABC transporter permease [Gemmatimonadales bacterium]|nr:ABC transporter permease [Gemmatimonadales bacterium]